MDNELYNMKLGDTLMVYKDYYILRVPGGWVYTNKGYNEVSSCFVPYNEEFLHTKKSNYMGAI